MDESLTQEIRAAIARIDDLLERTSRLLQSKDTSAPAKDESLSEARVQELDNALEDLATRVCKRPVSRSVWSPPGGAAFIRSANSAEDQAWLKALEIELRSTRAFFAAPLRGASPRKTTPDKPEMRPAPASPSVEKPADWWFTHRRWIAIAVIVAFVVVVLALSRWGAR
jgi:hypothetical protein